MKKLTVNRTVDESKKLIEDLLKGMFGKVKKENIEKDTVYYPAFQFGNLDALYTDVVIIARKLTNSKSVIIIDHKNSLGDDNWRSQGLEFVYNRVLFQVPRLFQE